MHVLPDVQVSSHSFASTFEASVGDASGSGSGVPASGFELPTKSSEVKSEQPNAVVNTTSNERTTHTRVLLVFDEVLLIRVRLGFKAPQVITPQPNVHPCSNPPQEDRRRW